MTLDVYTLLETFAKPFFKALFTLKITCQGFPIQVIKSKRGRFPTLSINISSKRKQPLARAIFLNSH